MLKMKLKYFDELNDILTELEIITHLQELARDAYSLYHDRTFDYSAAAYYLWDRQLETVTKLGELLRRGDFVCHIDDPVVASEKNSCV